MRRDLLLVGLLAAVLFLTALGARDLWNPNEPIYGEAVVEMAARGDWLVPHVNGMTFGEKPILFYWLALTASKLTGSVDELSLRLPAAGFGIAGTWLAYLLVLPYLGRRRATIASVLFATTYMVFWGARSVQMDLFVAVTTLGVIVPVTRVLDHGAKAPRGWALAGVAAGIGFLAKGPVAWICPGIALFLYAAVSRRLRELFRPAVLAGVATCLLVGAPWYLMLWGSGRTDVLEEVLVRQNFTRFRSAWDHAEPLWYYLEYFWIDLAPWSWLVPFAAALPGRTGEERTLARLAWCWILGIVLFFSLSQSKRSPYILPVAGAVAVLAAGVVERFLDGRLPRGRQRAVAILAAVVGGIFLAGGAYAAWKVPGRYPEVGFAARTLGAVVVIGGAAILAACLRRRPREIAWSFLGAIVALWLVTGAVALPAVNAYKSARPFCDEVASRAASGTVFVGWRFWDWRAEYAYYLRRPVRIVRDEEELRALWRGTEPVVVISDASNLDSLRDALGPVEPSVSRPVGGSVTSAFTPGTPSRAGSPR